jgi:hypothetical protein
MTAVAPAATNGRVPRMAISSMCRDGHHQTCKETRMVCRCECHGPDGQTGTTSPASSPPRRKPRAARPAPGQRKDMARLRETLNALAGPEPDVQPIGKRAPLIQLVKTDPPPPPTPKRKPTLTEQVRPLLEEILLAGERDWFRVVLFFKANQANFNIKKLAEAHSRTGWEWQARKLIEVDQSAIYVRWVGKEAQLT